MILKIFSSLWGKIFGGKKPAKTEPTPKPIGAAIAEELNKQYVPPAVSGADMAKALNEVPVVTTTPAPKKKAAKKSSKKKD